MAGWDRNENLSCDGLGKKMAKEYNIFKNITLLVLIQIEIEIEITMRKNSCS